MVTEAETDIPPCYLYVCIWMSWVTDRRSRTCNCKTCDDPEVASLHNEEHGWQKIGPECVPPCLRASVCAMWRRSKKTEARTRRVLVCVFNFRPRRANTSKPTLIFAQQLFSSIKTHAGK